MEPLMTRIKTRSNYHTNTEMTTECHHLALANIPLNGSDGLLLLLLVWHAPLGVRSAKRRHQSPEWTILSHSYRLIQ